MAVLNLLNLEVDNLYVLSCKTLSIKMKLLNLASPPWRKIFPWLFWCTVKWTNSQAHVLPWLLLIISVIREFWICCSSLTTFFVSLWLVLYTCPFVSYPFCCQLPTNFGQWHGFYAGVKKVPSFCAGHLCTLWVFVWFCFTHNIRSLRRHQCSICNIPCHRWIGYLPSYGSLEFHLPYYGPQRYWSNSLYCWSWCVKVLASLQVSPGYHCHLKY